MPNFISGTQLYGSPRELQKSSRFRGDEPIALIEFEVPQAHAGKAGLWTIGYVIDFLRRREAWDQLPSKLIRPGLALGIPLFSLGVGIMVTVETGYWRWNLELRA